MNVRLIGRGERSEALATLARAAGNRVVGEGAVEVPDLSIFDVAPGDFRTAVRSAGLGPGSRVLVATRGLEPETGRRLSEIVVEESACLRVGALGGPILPGEVARKSPVAGVVASLFDEVGELGTKALHSPACRIYRSRALAEVELAGALSEVLLVALGVARALGLGAAATALIVTRGAAEGGRLVRGGEAGVFSGLSGIGELTAAAGLAEHPAWERGAALVKGGRDEALAALCAALLQRARDLPITATMAKLSRGEIPAKAALGELISREARAESDR